MGEIQIDTRLKAALQGITPAINKRLIDFLPFAGFLLGLLMWFVDSFIDVFILHDEDSFSAALFSGEVTELWMRSLIVIIFVMAALVVQHFMRRQYASDQTLRRHQLHLERLVEERTRELLHMANVDSLTHIYNRRKFDEEFARELHRAKRYDQPLSMLLCDVDHFKGINDAFGHCEGDRVLMRIANVLGRNVRSCDTYARWGGEEFILLLPHTSIDDAEGVAEKLRAALSRVRYGDAGDTITVSFGIAQLQAEDNEDSMLCRADRALYRAKRSGRNQVCISY